MDQESILKEYSDIKKLEVYDNITQNLPTGKYLVTYNIKRLLPDVKGKTILDLPCGIGHHVREMFHLGAARVIAGDVVSLQLEFSKEKDKEIGIPHGFVDYHELDAKIPKQICNELADICLSFHLFCFAENEKELRGMAKTILTNLKAGGCCLIIACYLSSKAGDQEKVAIEMKRIFRDGKVMCLDLQSSNRFIPRRYHTLQEGFEFNRY